MEQNKEEVKYVVERFQSLKSNRAIWESHWQEIAEYIVPNRGIFTSSISSGSRLPSKILDSTGPWAAETLANALYGYLTNPAVRWFNVEPIQKEALRQDDVRAWCQFVTEHLYSVFASPRKRFYDQAHEIYQDITPFGTGVFMIEDRLGSGISFKSKFLSECFLDEDYDSNIDVFCRRFTMSLRQIIQQFGENNIPDSLWKFREKDPGKIFEIIHCIYPREDRNYSSFSGNNMPYASQYILLESNYLLKNGGYKDFPILAPRWSKRSDEVYGRGPGSIALSDIKMINSMKKTVLKGAQKVVDPPLQGPDNSFMSPIDMTPGATNFYTAGEDSKLEPILTNAQPDIGRDLMMDEKEAILRAFYVDKLQDSKSPNVEQTRAEYIGHEQERLIQMAPQLGRLHTEFMGPLIERTFRVEMRSGRLPAPPQTLQNQPLMVEYISPLARAQRMRQNESVTGAMQQLLPMIQVFPEILDSISPDKLAKWIFMQYDTPVEILNPAKEVERLRQKRTEQMEMQQQLSQMEQTSKAVKNVIPLTQGKGSKNAAG